MPVCVFEGCLSGSKRKDKVTNVNVHLHKSPKNPNLRKIWVKPIKTGSNVTHINCKTDMVLV